MRALPLPGGFVQIDAGAADLPPVMVKFTIFMALVGIENEWGRELVFTSGWRTVKYNRGCGGVATSKHLDGFAVDVRIREFTDTQKDELRAICPLYGLHAVQEGDHLHLEVP